MPSSVVKTFTDPYTYQKSVRAADLKVLVTASGQYWSELTRIDLHRLWLQRSRQTLPQIAHSTLCNDRGVILFLADARQKSMHHGGAELSPYDIVFNPLGAEHHHRMEAESCWGAMSLRPEDLAEAGRALAAADIAAPTRPRMIRPPPHLLSRLRSLHEAADHLARTTPEILAHPEVARALEQELTRMMVACLTTDMTLNTERRAGGRVSVMQKFERVLEMRAGDPLYLAEVCAAIGVTDRTLRQHCHDHLGMSPHRYLWLRRMHLARRALALAHSAATTVTEIASDNGFGELGRFAVAYRKLFGESPSATLRRPPDQVSGAQERTFR